MVECDIDGDSQLLELVAALGSAFTVKEGSGVGFLSVNVEDESLSVPGVDFI